MACCVSFTEQMEMIGKDGLCKVLLIQVKRSKTIAATDLTAVPVELPLSWCLNGN